MGNIISGYISLMSSIYLGVSFKLGPLNLSFNSFNLEASLLTFLKTPFRGYPIGFFNLFHSKGVFNPAIWLLGKILFGVAPWGRVLSPLGLHGGPGPNLKGGPTFRVFSPPW